MPDRTSPRGPREHNNDGTRSATEVSACIAEVRKDLERKERRRVTGLVYASEDVTPELLRDIEKEKAPEAAVLAALKEMGVPLLDPGACRDPESHAARLHNSVWRFVRRWYDLAEHPNVGERAKAAKYLKQVAALFTSKRRSGRNL